MIFSSSLKFDISVVIVELLKSIKRNWQKAETFSAMLHLLKAFWQRELEVWGDIFIIIKI